MREFGFVGWEEVAPSDEVEAADWIRGLLHPFAQDVGSVVPPGFAAYARIFHPAWRGTDGGSGRPIEALWSEIAAATGRIVHPEMQFHAIARRSSCSVETDDLRLQEPRPGVLSERQAGHLVGLLSRHTATPDSCWFCLWEGYGYLNSGPTVSARASRISKQVQSVSTTLPDRRRVSLPGRDYLLFRGRVTEGRSWEDGPNLWWPDDRAWCVASEIDFPYTYVGGTTELIGQILAAPGLESLPTTVTDGIWATSDKINS